MNKRTISRWEKMRTDETRAVERVLRQKFPNADAYRYNSASIRVRIIDPRFKGKSAEKRDAMIEPLIEQLPKSTQSDIMNLITLSPDEVENSLRASIANAEFEDPSPSKL